MLYEVITAKERMDTLVSNLLTAYAERIQATTWMSDTTKVRAMEKLHRITRKIGYPNHWKNYEGLVIERNQYFSNVVRTRQFAYNEMTARLGQPVDREAWLMTAVITSYSIHYTKLYELLLGL